MQFSLLRSLGARESIAIVIGVVIGTGVFLKTAVMAQLVGSPLAVLGAWAVAGALSLLGALTYAELGAKFPHSGGEYVFMREAYGRLPAFLFGWARFWIITPGSIAAYAVGAATFLGLEAAGLRIPVALVMLAFFTVLNCLPVALSGRIQTLLTALKVLMIVALAVGLFVFTEASVGLSRLVESGSSEFHWSPFGAAVLAALWAFDGWNNLPLAAGEVSDPKRNLPFALIGGITFVFLIYAAINVAYFYSLPLDQIVSSSSARFPDSPPVAARAAGEVLGSAAVSVLSLMFVLSALGAMNGSILTGARVPMAMAADGLFPRHLGHINGKTRVPVIAVLVQGVIASLLAASGTFDQLTDYVIFTSWIFYALVAGSIFIHRQRLRRAAAVKDSYEVPFYPWLPLVFVAASVVLLANTLWTSPRESLVGLAFMIAGLVPGTFWCSQRVKTY